MDCIVRRVRERRIPREIRRRNENLAFYTWERFGRVERMSRRRNRFACLCY